MSQSTRQEVLVQLRRRYARAGRNYKAQLIGQVVARCGYHRQAAIRALRAKPAPARAPFAPGPAQGIRGSSDEFVLGLMEGEPCW